MKYCPRCDSTKPLALFSKNKARGDGLQQYCKACRKLLDAALYANRDEKRKKYIVTSRRAAYIKTRARLYEYLQQHPCVDCGENDIRVLDFDHVRGEKRNHVTRLRGCSWKTILVEIAKCEVRCANCHRRKTANQFGYYADVP